VVLSGHGPQTTIGRERDTNPFLREVAAGGHGGGPSAAPRRGM
jgi:hydroxyacylglutathione hydrolase